MLGGLMLHQNHSQSHNQIFCQCFSYKVWCSLGFSFIHECLSKLYMHLCINIIKTCLFYMEEYEGN